MLKSEIFAREINNTYRENLRRKSGVVDKMHKCCVPKMAGSARAAKMAALSLIFRAGRGAGRPSHQ